MPTTHKSRAKKKTVAPSRRPKAQRQRTFVPPTLSDEEIAEENGVATAAAKDVAAK